MTFAAAFWLGLKWRRDPARTAPFFAGMRSPVTGAQGESLPDPAELLLQNSKLELYRWKRRDDFEFLSTLVLLRRL